MLKVRLTTEELFNEETMEIIPPRSVDVKLEHSLISISKWESKWKLPLLGTTNLTGPQLYDYIRCMIIGPESDILDDKFMESLSSETTSKIISYINDPMTATTITTYENEKSKKKPDREIKTSELIYHYMISLEIPFETQRWHINRLLTLIQIRNAKLNSDNDKMSEREILANNRKLNAQRKAKFKK